MFGESIRSEVKLAAEQAVDAADRILVVGSSLATYSAWRLVKRAKDKQLPIGIINIGGVRSEDGLISDLDPRNQGEMGMRCDESAEKVLPALVEILKSQAGGR